MSDTSNQELIDLDWVYDSGDLNITSDLINEWVYNNGDLDIV